MTPEPVRLGILGTGAISQVVHLPVLTRRSDVKVVAVADVDEHKAEHVADRFDVPRVVSVEELMEAEDLSGLVICTPNHVHEDQAVAALEGGKHVLVERPLALTGEGAERTVEAARKAGRALVVGMSHRYRPDATALASFVAGGELGEVYAVRSSRLQRTVPTARPTWRHQKEKAGGGALVDLGVQTLDLALWLVDYPEIERVTASTHTGELEVEDAASLLAVGRDGTSVSVEVSWSYYGPEDRHHTRIMGTGGSGSLPPLSVHQQVGGRPLDITPEQPRGRENPYTAAYRRELEHFVAVVAGERDAPLPVEQARLMRLIAAAYRSAEEGREVDVS